MIRKLFQIILQSNIIIYVKIIHICFVFETIFIYASVTKIILEPNVFSTVWHLINVQLVCPVVVVCKAADCKRRTSSVYVRDVTQARNVSSIQGLLVLLSISSFSRISSRTSNVRLRLG